MNTLTVTTATDTTDASDGVLSLREALAAAGTAKGAVNIVFDAAAFVTGTNVPSAIVLDERLEFGGGARVTVDGSLAGSFYNVRIEPGPDGDRLLTVQSGAELTLRDIVFSGGTSINPVVGADGMNGSDGTRGAFGANGMGEGAPGEDAQDGTAGGDGAEGDFAVGGIVNNGSLVLERVVIQSIGARGGDGGYGGEGGDGGRGGNGGVRQEGSISPTASGGDGGDAMDGGAGGRGGNAAGAIFNTGDLTLRDVGFRGVVAYGGDGGVGGPGGAGGTGGRWTGVQSLTPDLGGDGGDGANGGAGGVGGTAAAAVWSVGRVTIDGPQSTPIIAQISSGTGAQGGEAGRLGSGGTGLDYVPRAVADGADGSPGSAGAGGAPGESGAFVGLTTATATVFSVSHDGATASEAGDAASRLVGFTVSKLGEGEGSVSWRVAKGNGVTAADFEGGVLPGGKIDFSSGGTLAFRYLQVADDGLAEGDEEITIELFGARGGVLGWSSSISFTLDDGGPGVIRGTPRDDPALTGTDDADLILGLAGNDRLTGLGGKDTLDGGAGNDRLDGGGGADRMTGGQGSDTYVVDNLGDRVSESRSGAGTDTVLSSVSFRMDASHIENLSLTGSADIRGIGNDLSNNIRGNDGDNILDGGKNADTLIGGAGNDTYIIDGRDTIIEKSAQGTDTIQSSVSFTLGLNLENLALTGSSAIKGTGNSLANEIVGNSGANLINGASGSDSLTGGRGSDTFIFNSALGSRNVDVITDYNVAADTIRLENAIFTDLATGNLAKSAFAANKTGNAADASDRIIYERDTGKLYFDVDGRGGAAKVLFADLDAGLNLTNADFFVI